MGKLGKITSPGKRFTFAGTEWNMCSLVSLFSPPATTEHKNYLSSTVDEEELRATATSSLPNSRTQVLIP